MISEEGENFGVLSKEDALKIAVRKDLDLVIIAEKANPPVAKVLDFKKFLYQERKKASSAKAKSKKSELKELRFGPSTGEEDVRIRVERAKEFFEEGNRVKLTVILRGREKAHPELGYEKINEVVKNLEDVAKPEKEPTKIGGNISVTLVSK